MHFHTADADIAYEILGKGPDLVLLHPFPANREVWRPVAEQLATRYRVTLPDLRGHGDSGAGDGPATMQKHADDLEALCRELGIGKAVFAGNSIGGYILFEFWRQHRQRFAGLILAGTRAGADSDEARNNRLASIEDVQDRGPEPFLQQMLGKLLCPSTHRNRPDLVDQVRSMMQKMTVADIVAVQQGMAQRPDSTPTLPTIDVPALILVGDEDTVTGLPDAQIIHRGIRGSTMKVVPKAGHYVPFERAEDVHIAMWDFLGDVRW